MCLLEPRISGSKADAVSRKLGFINWIRVESNEYVEGIWLLWNKSDCSVDYILSTPQVLHCSVQMYASREKFVVYVVYGETKETTRMDLWSSIRSLASSISDPWILIGDFNSMLSPDDKNGGHPPPELWLITSERALMMPIFLKLIILVTGLLGKEVGYKRELTGSLPTSIGSHHSRSLKLDMG